MNEEFDEFLYAPILADEKATSLSVVSALAQLNLDPWEEAAALARMSKDAAIGRFATLIACLPALQSQTVDCRAIASRLVALLPLPSRISSAKAGGVRFLDVPSRGNLYLLLAICLVTALLLFAIAQE